MLVLLEKVCEKVEMITLQTLLSLTLIGLFWAPKLLDSEKPTKLDRLPVKCWEKIFSFGEFHFYEHCASACFKISTMKTACDDVFVSNEMIDRCRLAGRKDRHGLHSFFSLFEEEERVGIGSELKKRIELIEQIADSDLLYKYRGTKPPEGSDDSKKIELLKSYKETHRSTLKKEKLYCLKQIELLELYGIFINRNDTESDSTSSTMSTNADGSEHDLESDHDSD